MYLNWNLYFLPLNATATIEIFLLLIMLFFTWFKRTFKKVSGTARTRAIMQAFLTAIAIIDLIVALAT